MCIRDSITGYQGYHIDLGKDLYVYSYLNQLKGNVFSNESGAQSAASNGNVGGSGIDVVGMLTDGMKKTIIDKANACLLYTSRCV